MPEDETNPPFTSETSPSNQTKTATQTETIETSVDGKRPRQVGELFGMSGRFWVCIFSIVGSTYIVGVVLVSDLQSETKAASAMAYIALAASVANTYMGQNKSKPN